MPLLQRQNCVPAADGDAVQPALAPGCAAAKPVNDDDNARAQNPAREKPLMPASVCVLGTVQGDADTVPYHTRRLLKSAGMVAILSRWRFPGRRDQLSVTAPCRARQCGARAVAAWAGWRGVHQPRATLPRYGQGQFEDHENDVVECVMDAAANVEESTQTGSRNMVNRRA